MATVDDFKNAVRDRLAQNGTLKKMQASIRAEIIETLAETTTRQEPPKPKDTYVIDELIREYLEFHGYRSSLSVFVPESGLQQSGSLGREFLAGRIGIKLGPQSEQLPLLYSAIGALSKSNT